MKSLHPKFEDDVGDVWSFEASVEARDAIGGTAKSAVLEQIAKLRGLNPQTWGRSERKKKKVNPSESWDDGDIWWKRKVIVMKDDGYVDTVDDDDDDEWAR